MVNIDAFYTSPKAVEKVQFAAAWHRPITIYGIPSPNIKVTQHNANYQLDSSYVTEETKNTSVTWWQDKYVIMQLQPSSEDRHKFIRVTTISILKIVEKEQATFNDYVW